MYSKLVTMPDRDDSGLYRCVIRQVPGYPPYYSVLLGSLQNSCYDGSRLRNDWRDNAILDGVRSSQKSGS